jgi:hypothetical protein
MPSAYRILQGQYEYKTGKSTGHQQSQLMACFFAKPKAEMGLRVEYNSKKRSKVRF